MGTAMQRDAPLRIILGYEAIQPLFASERAVTLFCGGGAECVVGVLHPLDEASIENYTNGHI